jgi:hypothetical protein
MSSKGKIFSFHFFVRENRSEGEKALNFCPDEFPWEKQVRLLNKLKQFGCCRIELQMPECPFSHKSSCSVKTILFVGDIL